MARRGGAKCPFSLRALAAALVLALGTQCAQAQSAARDEAPLGQASRAEAGASDRASDRKPDLVPGQTTGGAADVVSPGELVGASDYRFEVLGSALLPGLGLRADDMPVAAQTLRGTSLDTRRSSNLAQTLDRQLAGVNLNDTTGNPFQFDLQFRGFTASPALGTPQGLSVFLDGVRINESFGDTVNWDLIPDLALAQVTVLPGSNPLYGLNTLGGAIALTTHRGFDEPETLARVQVGQFGRRALEMQTGGHSGQQDYYLAARRWHDGGWAAQSNSEIRQLFGQWGWRSQPLDVNLRLAWANNAMEGSQTLPLSFSNTPRDAYTYPDAQTNHMGMVNLQVRYRLDTENLLEAQLYWRQTRSDAVNSNVNDEFDTTATVGAGNEPTGNDYNHVSQSRPGGTVQWTRALDWLGLKHQFVLGATVDAGHTVFRQAEQEAGSSRDTRSDEPVETTTDLHATQVATGWFAADRVRLTESTLLSLAMRRDTARVALHDQMGTELNGHHQFQHWSPSVGMTWAVQPEWTLFGSYSQGLRVPTPVELTCADPDAPCALPNAFVADPPLKAVRSHSVEAGLRTRALAGVPGLAATISGFHTELIDDIQFISAGGTSTNAGYFQNVGRTRRQGVDFSLMQGSGHWRWDARYSVLWATFETPLVLNSPNHSEASAISCTDCTEIAVKKGDRLPGLPRQMLKVHLEADVFADWTVGLGWRAQSKIYARGDESNNDSHGPVPAFALLDLDTQWRVTPEWTFTARVDNVLDRRYSSFATLGQNVFTGPGRTFDTTGTTWRSEPFRAQGAPRSFGVSLTWTPRWAPS